MAFVWLPALSVAAASPPHGLTPWAAPIRGFNSWQAFRYWISEEEVVDVAAALKRRGFVAEGYVKPFLIKFRPNPLRLSSRTTADLHQPPFRATAAVCRRPLGRRTDLNGRKLTLFV